MTDETIHAFIAHTRQLLDFVENGEIPFTDEAQDGVLYDNDSE